MPSLLVVWALLAAYYAVMLTVFLVPSTVWRQVPVIIQGVLHGYRNADEED